MTVRELIQQLEEVNPDFEVMINDQGNVCGVLRTINYGPTESQIDTSDVHETADCEGRFGEFVVTIGFGCY